jgi:hypothetical protein
VSNVRAGTVTRGEEDWAGMSMGVRIRVGMKEDLFVFRHKGALSPYWGDLANLAKNGLEAVFSDFSGVYSGGRRRGRCLLSHSLTWRLFCQNQA